MAMSFVPHALMAGFCSGAAIVIALSQMTNIMGKCSMFLKIKVLFLLSRYVDAGGKKVIVSNFLMSDRLQS